MGSEIVINQQYSTFNPVQFGYEQCNPEHQYGPAVRDFWLLHYVVSGTGLFQINGHTYHPRSGDMFVIPPHVETTYRADTEEPWCYIWIGFTCEEPMPLTLESVIHCPEGQAVFEKMKHCHYLENGRSAFLTARLWDLAGLLLDKRTEVTDPVEKALHCMHAEYMNPLTITDIASRLNLERTYFSSLFKKKMHMSPQQYLLRLRMETAAKLITEQGERPSTAAISVGYTDLFNFSRMFKRYFGTSPRVYAAQYKDKRNTQAIDE